MMETIVKIRIELEGTDPVIWRELDVPLTMTLARLHDVIQIAMRWWDYHLYEFEVGDRLYGNPLPEFEDLDYRVYHARCLRLSSVIKRGIRDFVYVYDFGDNWRHRITVGEPRQGDADVDYPRFIAGGRRAPPEDVGGTPGYEDFLAAVMDVDHDDHERMLEWYGRSYDPKDIDEHLVRMLIEDVARRRRGPLMRHRSQTRSRGIYARGG